MMAATAEGSQLQRIIRDLQAAVTELSREFKETGEPVTDDSTDLRTFFYKVEYLLQFDQKEKFTLLGNRKDYWDYFCDCLAKEKGANDGVRFVKSISELKTSLGKGRAFLRYSLVHQRLADTLQQCFMNTKVTSDWYYARSPFLKPEMSSYIIGHLYELTDVPFDLASRGYDLDATWPTFARKTVTSPGSPAFTWKPPSRSSSMSSLVSGYLQAQEFSTNLDLNNSLCPEPLAGSTELRIELDQSEVKLKELQDRYQHLERENVELQGAIELLKAQAEKNKNIGEESKCLTNVTEDSQKQCNISHSTQTTAQKLQTCQQTLEPNTSKKQHYAEPELLETIHSDYASQLQLLTQELETTRAEALLKAMQIEELKVKTTTAEQNNLELLARIDAILKEKGLQPSTQNESELKIQELLEQLRDSEMEKAMFNEQKVQIQQLQEQIESLNRNHVEELMQFKEREEALKKEIEKECHNKAELEKNLLCLKDELLQSKEYADTVKLENMETKEALRRTYTEMAELGIQICALSSEKEDAELRLEQASKQLRELEQQAAVETERLQLNLAELRKENESLGKKLEQLEESTTAIPHLKRELNETQKQAETFKALSDEEISTVKFQMSADILNYENKLKAVAKECEQATEDLEKQKQKRVAAEKELAERQASQDELRKQMDQATEKVMQYESTMQTQEEETISLKEHLERTQTELEEANKQAKEYCEKLKRTLLEKESNEQKLEANVDDLTRTKEFLEERLVELIRDKDMLWQKSDALEYEQKIRAEERWLGDTEVNHCLDCHRQFSWMVRRHHCRVCGGIFCYYCCNNYKMTKHSGKKERCCNACYNAPSVVVISDNDSEGSSSQESPLPLDYAATSETRGVTVTDEDTKPLDDVVFDIITDEELSQIQEGNSFLTENQMEGYSRDLSAADPCSSCSSLTLDEPDDLQLPQDNEIRLLKTGELMLKLPLTLEDISSFGENHRELFIKSSTYSIIPITVTETGLTISWVFSSDTKSIAFSVVYQESEDATLDQFKVLIPMTRCDSHKETIRGQLKARNCGIYTLIFDNSFSRFISKRVFYHLTVERPVVYDGSDFP